MPTQGWIRLNVTYSPRVLIAIALDESKERVLATAMRKPPLAASGIVLSLDAPSPDTGTGVALYLDGSDVALVRATIVDANGDVCEDATNVVTFQVVAGPGLVWGTGNGGE